MYISIVSRNHVSASQPYQLYIFVKAVKEGELTVSLTDKASLIARCSSGKISLLGAEKKALLLGQLYVGPNSLWAPFVVVIVQLLYCLVLCSGFAGRHQNNFWFVCPTTIGMLNTALILRTELENGI